MLVVVVVFFKVVSCAERGEVSPCVVGCFRCADVVADVEVQEPMVRSNRCFQGVEMGDDSAL